DHALWIHWGAGAAPDTLQVSLRGLTSGTTDGPLAHGDRLLVRFVPGYRAGAEVQLMGEVSRPGGYPVAMSGTRLSEVVAAAGGLLPTAETSGILIRRPAASPPEPEPELVNKLEAQQRDFSVSEYEALQARLASRTEEIRVDWRQLLEHPRTLDPLLL